jgi:hypothetical protein
MKRSYRNFKEQTFKPQKEEMGKSIVRSRGEEIIQFALASTRSGQSLKLSHEIHSREPDSITDIFWILGCDSEGIMDQEQWAMVMGRCRGGDFKGMNRKYAA